MKLAGGTDSTFNARTPLEEFVELKPWVEKNFVILDLTAEDLVRLLNVSEPVAILLCKVRKGNFNFVNKRDS